MESFQVGDFAVYPGRGVGRVAGLESKSVAGHPLDFWVVLMEGSGLRLYVPRGQEKSVGLRPLMSKPEAEKVLEILQSDEKRRLDHQTWNRRFREYTDKIKTGSVYDVAVVLRDLFHLKIQKDLSFGERAMLETARNLLGKELLMIFDRSDFANEEPLRQMMGWVD